jgi:UDP-N-acetyl-2-amino-2-deoxyglucuronate dehydrogenase
MSAPPRLRVAVIGLGMASTPHARSLADLRDRVEVAAVFSPSTQRREAFAAAWGFPAVDSIEAILADSSIAAVLLLTPPNTHLELVQQAAAAHKHILLEKPLDISLERSELLVKTAEKADVKLAVVLQNRFRPTCEKLSALIAEGRLGVIVSASARINNWRPQSYYDQPGRGTKARDGGGVLLTQAIHTLDLLVAFAGVPTEVKAFCATSPVHRMETEDLAMAAIRFAGGAIGSITATTCAYPGFPDAIDIIGTKGTARLEGGLESRFHDGSDVSLNDGTAGNGAGADPMAFSHDYHRALLADFLDSVASGRAPRVSGREALKVHTLIEAILRSSQKEVQRQAGEQE